MMTYYEIYTKDDDEYYLYNIRSSKNDAINEADEALRDDDEDYVEVREVTGENVKVVYSREKNGEERDMMKFTEGVEKAFGRAFRRTNFTAEKLTSEGEERVFGVNWSAIGTASPEEAEEYAEEIIQCARLARALNEAGIKNDIPDEGKCGEESLKRMTEDMARLFNEVKVGEKSASELKQFLEEKIEETRADKGSSIKERPKGQEKD